MSSKACFFVSVYLEHSSLEDTFNYQLFIQTSIKFPVQTPFMCTYLCLDFEMVVKLTYLLPFTWVKRSVKLFMTIYRKG